MNPMRQPTQPVTVAPKSRGISMWTFVITILVVALTAFAVGTRYYDLRSTNATPDFSALNEVYSQLARNFDGDLDSAALINGAKRGMVEAVGDPYTQFFTSDEAREFLNDLDGSFQGIGAELGQRDGKLIVVSTIDDSPARKAGLQAGDIIVKINDQDSASWTAEEAVAKIRGEAGTTVKLTIMRGDEVTDFTITRAEITDPSVKWEINDGIGYMRISRFGDADTSILSKRAASEFADAGVRGIILDLRGNGGGYVSSALDVSGLWLPSGETVVIEKRGDKVISTERSSGQAILYGIPTVALIDGGTASASEIVAGALSDNGAAELVGEQSFGKGVVQVIVELRNGDQLKVTTAKWYTPNGANIDHEGITPDEFVEMTAEQWNAGNDAQRERALEILNR